MSGVASESISGTGPPPFRVWVKVTGHPLDFNLLSAGEIGRFYGALGLRKSIEDIHQRRTHII